ncbi:protein FAR-RED IMPAIRED RESPONSE 1-like [Chenopodium quinoa]|uniref:protein FAR-RED IMPAIRED RESPONSE 1-like n=1 Tax=Chenopodium quinoa TaxID=63459 RepID=UPI000B783440|nr:protein FAR-RED IMPAIRED RESPONSE 1-like [Chenopodium quinoa]
MPTTLKISKIKRAVTCAGNSNTRRKVAGKRIARELEGEPIATKKSKKCGCGAMVYGSLTCNGKWELKKVCLEHSHTHSPSKSMIVTEYRLEELEKVSYIRRTLHFGNVVGFPNAKLHRWLASERNGYENLAFTTVDLNNLAAKEKKLKFKDGVANVMMNYFKMMQTIRTFTMYIGWMVMAFFRMCCGLMHVVELRMRISVTLRVFLTWLDAVGGSPPMAILTDQDSTMRKALEVVMPQTRHGWCLWHITEKFSVKLGKCKGYLDFKEELRWKEFIHQHKLVSNMWLACLYDEREMWIPAAMKHLFWARMKTKQRLESIHNFFYELFYKNIGLCDFTEKYVAAIEQQMQSKRLADGKSTVYLRDLVTDFKF